MVNVLDFIQSTNSYESVLVAGRYLAKVVSVHHRRPTFYIAVYADNAR